MNLILTALRRHAADHPRRLAMQDGMTSLTYEELLHQATELAQRLRALEPHGVAVFADNGCAWALADIALHVAGIPSIPLPLFFSSKQIAHAIRASGADRILTDQPSRVNQALGVNIEPAPFHLDLQLLTLPGPTSIGAELAPGTTKVTFTSGTTGEPKGVCLGRDQIETVAQSLRTASVASADDCHLCLLPLATLLENIAGLYTPLLAGARICIPSLSQVGLAGSSGLDVSQMVTALNTWRPSSLITVPQTLQALVGAAQAGLPMPSTLRYVAVGGAPVSAELLRIAQTMGLPVYEGFGLSECGSVVAVNRPGENRPGSVGKPLAHVRLDFAADGEILLLGVPWRGYLNGDAPPRLEDGRLATGDIGHLDEDGFLHVTGRKKNIFITSFGRNVAPEWIERELVLQAPVLQAAVFGEGRRFNTAIVFASPDADAASIDAAIESANRLLPDYARVTAWIRAGEPFTPANGTLTHNGRPRREVLLSKYTVQLNAIYQSTHETRHHS